MNALRRGRTVLTAGAAAGLVLAAASCSSGGVDAAGGTGSTGSTATSAASAASATSTAPGGSGSTAAPSATGAPGGASAPKIALDGNERHLDFDRIRCEWGTDEGHSQLEYKAQKSGGGAELEVEIVMSEPPKLDDFELELTDEEWEATDADRAQAQITVDGDDYRVVSPVTNDAETQTVEMDVSFTCSDQGR